MAGMRAVAVILVAGVVAVTPKTVSAQSKNAQTHETPPPARANPPEQRNFQQPNNGQGQNRNPNARAKAQSKGDEQFMRLQKMTPEERDKALEKLPPARREQIEKRLRNFDNLPQQVQERRLDRLQKLNSLPMAQQAQVRQSMKDLQALPNDRKKAVNQELQRMSVMGDEERQYHMGTEEFRNRFSQSEQDMLGNLAKVY